MNFEQRLEKAFNETLKLVGDEGFESLDSGKFLEAHKNLSLKPDIPIETWKKGVQYYIALPGAFERLHGKVGDDPHELAQIVYSKKSGTEYSLDKSTHNISITFFPGLEPPIINPQGKSDGMRVYRRWIHLGSDLFRSETKEGSMDISFADTGNGCYVPTNIREQEEKYYADEDYDEDTSDPTNMLIKVSVRDPQQIEREEYVGTIKFPNLILGRGDLTSFFNHMQYDGLEQ